MYPTWLVLLHLDDRDEVLLATLRSVARRAGARRVALGHVTPRPPVPPAILPGGGEPTAPERLERLAAELDAELDGVAVEARFESGEPRIALAHLLRDVDPDLVVVGRAPSPDGRPVRGGLGPVALRGAHCSVLVVPRDATVDLSRAVVGMDFSEPAIEALRVATELCDEVVAVFQYDSRWSAPGSLTDEEVRATFERNAQRHFVGEVLPRIRDDLPTPPALQVIEGRRADEVLVECAGRRLVVVGALGLTAFASELLGSMAEGVATRARGPVLVHRRKGERLGLLAALARR